MGCDNGLAGLSEMVVLRAYQDGDDDAIIDVWERASALAHPFLSDDFIASEKIAIREQYLPNTQTHVTTIDDRLVGFASLMGDELGALFLSPEFHGRGMGRALVDHAVKSRQFLDVEVFENNAIGRRFYNRYGFVQTGQTVHEPTGQSVIRMRWTPANTTGAR